VDVAKGFSNRNGPGHGSAAPHDRLLANPQTTAADLLCGPDIFVPLRANDGGGAASTPPATPMRPAIGRVGCPGAGRSCGCEIVCPKVRCMARTEELGFSPDEHGLAMISIADLIASAVVRAPR